jgi:hypothetical protein
MARFLDGPDPMIRRGRRAPADTDAGRIGPRLAAIRGVVGIADVSADLDRDGPLARKREERERLRGFIGLSIGIRCRPAVIDCTHDPRNCQVAIGFYPAPDRAGIRTTRKVLACIPAETCQYKPSEKCMSALELGTHIAAAEAFFLSGVLNGGFE